MSAAVPDNFPYTTAASEFLYGYQTVAAALKADRRKLYNLYVHERGRNHEGAPALLSRAKAAGVQIHHVDDRYLSVMDRASSGRPHNVSDVLHYIHVTQMSDCIRASSLKHPLYHARPSLD